MSQLVLPAASLALFTIAVYFWQAAMATRALTSGALARAGVVYPGSSTGPDWAERPRRNYVNLVEMPTLFYAATAIEIAGGGGDGFQLILAWIYVALRVAHTIIHIALNPVLIRFLTFSASALVLAVMWGRLVWSAL